jgi:hypothetical protein
VIAHCICHCVLTQPAYQMDTVLPIWCNVFQLILDSCVRGCIQKLPGWVITKLTVKHSLRSNTRWPVRKLLDTPSYSVALSLRATGWTIEILGFDSRRGLGIFLFTNPSRTALGSTQHPIQWVPRALSLGVKRPEREAENSPPSSVEVKHVWGYTSSPPTRLHGVVLI